MDSSLTDKGPGSENCDDEDDCIGGSGSGESPVDHRIDDSNNGYDPPTTDNNNKKPDEGDDDIHKQKCFRMFQRSQTLWCQWFHNDQRHFFVTTDKPDDDDVEFYGEPGSKDSKLQPQS